MYQMHIRRIAECKNKDNWHKVGLYTEVIQNIFTIFLLPAEKKQAELLMFVSLETFEPTV
jgi:hypothetical protein